MLYIPFSSRFIDSEDSHFREDGDIAVAQALERDVDLGGNDANHEYNPAFQDASYLPSFIEPITAILVSRFLLDLQYANHKSVGIVGSQSSTHHDSRGDGSGSVSLTFERFVGSMGTSIAPGDGGENDVEDEI